VRATGYSKALSCSGRIRPSLTSNSRGRSEMTRSEGPRCWRCSETGQDGQRRLGRGNGPRATGVVSETTERASCWRDCERRRRPRVPSCQNCRGRVGVLASNGRRPSEDDEVGGSELQALFRDRARLPAWFWWRHDPSRRRHVVQPKCRGSRHGALLRAEHTRRSVSRDEESEAAGVVAVSRRKRAVGVIPR
jgi:hypothetical protein